MDVWVGSSLNLQKCSHGQADMIELMEYLLSRLSLQEMELFLVQAWIIWNQRNSCCMGGRFKIQVCYAGELWSTWRNIKTLKEICVLMVWCIQLMMCGNHPQISSSN